MGVAERGRAGIDEEDDRRLQALGGVGGHDPHLAAALLHLAFDRGRGGGQPCKEGIEAGFARFLVGQRQIEEGIDDLTRIRAEPARQPGPATLGAENAGIEGEDGLEARTGTQFVEPRQRVAAFGQKRLGRFVGHEFRHAGKSLRPADPPQAERQRLVALAGQGQPHQVVVGEIEEGRLQDGGEGQIVLEIGHRPAERHQILHRDMVGDDQPVGAGDRNAGVAQRLGHGGDEAGALAHQDDDVTRRQRAHRALVGDGIADPVADLGGDPPRQPVGRGIGRLVVDRLQPVARLRLFLGLVDRPDLDEARRLAPRRLVRRRLVAGRQALAVFRIGKDGVHRPQDVGGGAEGLGQPHLLEARLGGLGALPHGPLLVGEHARRGALEGVDRLLFVADGEDRAGDLAGPGAGEELLHQLAHHLPLARTGVLRLVDQHMVDALVELVMDPRGGGRAGQELGGPHDQILEIQPPAPALEDGVVALEGVGDHQRRGAGAEQPQAGEALVDHLDVVGQLLQPLGKVGQGVGHGLGGDARRLVGRALGRQAQRLQRGEPRVGRAGVPERLQAVVELGVGRLGTGGGKAHGAVAEGRVEARRIVCRREDRGLVLAGLQPEGIAQERDRRIDPAGLVEMPPDGVAPVDDLADELVEAPFAGQRQCRGKGVRQRRGGFVRCLPRRAGDQQAPRFGQQGHALGVVQNLEMPRNVRFQRKLVEDRLAEGVDGLDLQPARRLQRFGEEPARDDHSLRRRRPAVEPGDLRREVGILGGRPFRQPCEDAARHLGRRRLGVGQAEDLRRLDLRQEQPHDAFGQDMGLARAGIGRHEDRAFGVCGDGLQPCRFGNAGKAAHAAPPSAPSPPSSAPIDHSCARAR